MSEGNMIRLGTIPLVRRLEYLDVYLGCVDRGMEKMDIEAALSERKKAFEVEKDLALGRGRPYYSTIAKAGKLIEHCLRLSRDMRYVDKVGTRSRLLDAGRRYLNADGIGRRRMFSESFSLAYPHMTALVSALSRLEGGEMVLPQMNNPEFKPEVERYGLSIGQINFDTLRDLATGLGLVNWYAVGVGSERRQHVYASSRLLPEQVEPYLVRIRGEGKWLYAVQLEVNRAVFREALWEEYLSIARGVPGSPVFYSLVRERVCSTLRIRDDQFDSEVLGMVDSDEVLHVIWSEGVLPYQQDTASMLKSLPPKNEWGRYIVYLKIVRR